MSDNRTSLADFVSNLASDSDHQERYKENKNAYIDGMNISDEHKEVLKGGDAHAIGKAMGQELANSRLGLW